MRVILTTLGSASRLLIGVASLLIHLSQFVTACREYLLKR